ncbi:MAG: hypothetical protein ACREIV_13375, partial [Planctomycetaceae bacterium]
VLTGFILGFDVFQIYVEDVLPLAVTWKTAFNNASVAGFWHKLFDPGWRHGRTTIALLHSPMLAQIGTVVTDLLIYVVIGAAVLKARSRVEQDCAFGMALIGMLLLSPVTWEHYLLMLLIPIAVVWLVSRSSRAMRWSLAATVAALSAPVLWIIDQTVPGGFNSGVATPWHTLTVLSFQLYALLVLLGLCWWALKTQQRRFVAPECVEEPESELENQQRASNVES